MQIIRTLPFGFKHASIPLAPETYHTNPQYHIQVRDVDDDEDDLGTVVVGLMQKGRRRLRAIGQGNWTIGYDIYSKVSLIYLLLLSLTTQFSSLCVPIVWTLPLICLHFGIFIKAWIGSWPQGNGQCNDNLDRKFFDRHNPVTSSPSYINMREVCGRHKLPPGDYCLIPTTFESNEEGDFVVRVFSEKETGVSYVYFALISSRCHPMCIGQTQMLLDHGFFQGDWYRKCPCSS